jgi:hypothetical protein
MYPMLVSLLGFIIALAIWPTQTDSTARFLTGVLVGLSIASLIAGIVAYAGDRRVRTSKHAGH